MHSDVVLCAKNVGTIFAVEEGENANRFGGIFIDKLQLEGHGIVAIMGESGSGKSTLLSLISGLKGANAVSSHAGQSCLQLLPDGANTRDLLIGETPRAGSVGYVFQDSHLMKTLSVALNVDMARALTQPPLDQHSFKGLMASFGLRTSDTPEGKDNLRDKRVANLSGGQQQRVAVARAIAAKPRIVFCDEPTSSLDPVNARRIMCHLRDWAEQNKAVVLWVTHDETLAMTFASSMLYVQNGQLVSNDGRPVPLDPQESDEDRKAKLQALKARAAKTPLDLSDTTAAGLILDPTRAERLNANAANTKAGQPAKYTLLGGLAFLWRFVWAELFQGQPVSGTRRHGAGRLANRIWRGPWQFTRPTFALIVLLGVIAAYGMIFGLAVLDAKFARDLSQPEVSHFTLERYGAVDSTADDLLSRKALTKMEKDLQTKFPVAPDSGYQKLKIFGRMLELGARTAEYIPESEENDGCKGARTRAGSAALMVYKNNEPLYQAQVTATGDRLGDFPKKDLRGKVFVTRSFLARRFEIEEGDPIPARFCLGTEKALAPVEIAGILPDIPGSKTLSAEIAMTDDAYLRLHNTTKMRPNNWGTGWPPFDSAALYFDSEYAADLFCTIDECEDKPELFDQVYGPSYKLNDDALEQIKGLLDIALGSRQLLIAVVSAMALSTTISVALSVQAFIASHERFLSIMRAVGYRYGHIAILVLMELAVITFVAAAFALAVLLVFHALWAPELAAKWGLPAAWMAWSTQRLALAVAIAFGVVTGVGLTVTTFWWKSHRYVGHKLQTV